jgi:hypothetical protein
MGADSRFLPFHVVLNLLNAIAGFLMVALVAFRRERIPVRRAAG